eukprot:309725-Prorocentrum_lima.AAC.1
MHPSLWLMTKGRKPEKMVSTAEVVPPDKFAETHTWIKGQVKGRVAPFVDSRQPSKVGDHEEGTSFVGQ